MGTEQSTIQSLKAVDQWIDVINANINGGVRTGFKSSRLKFGGTNVDIEHGGTGGSLPLQIPESGLATSNTVIDFSQGAVTASTENTHLAIQGEGFFVVVSPDCVNAKGTLNAATAASKMYVTRDGEFHADQNGLLVNNAGYYLITAEINTASGQISYPWISGAGNRTRLVFDDLDNTTPPAVGANGGLAYKLSDYINNTYTLAGTLKLADNTTTENGSGAGWTMNSILRVAQGKQSLQFSQLGSTIFDPQVAMTGPSVGFTTPTIFFQGAKTSDATILSKSLEASNASMTQSVPELSLAQKLFSALTKVLQIHQTDTDSVLNLIR